MSMALSGAYVTFLAGDGDDVKGVVGLAKGLRKVRSSYPLVVAVLDVPKENQKILEEQGCVVREIQEIKLVHPFENRTQFAPTNYVVNYSKLHIWEFVDYRTMVYLEANMQVFHNIDDLFNKPAGHFYAVPECFCEKTWSHTSQHDRGYCQCQHRPNGDQMDPPPSYFNDSMFVFEPNITIYNTLFNILQNTLPSPIAMQECLETHFRDVYRPLSLEHNLALSMLWRHPEKVNLETVKVVHYCEAGTKPWRYTRQENTNNMQRGSIEMQVKQLCKFVVQEEIDALVKRWTDIYEDESLDYKNWLGWLMTGLSLVCCQMNWRQTD